MAPSVITLLILRSDDIFLLVSRGYLVEYRGVQKINVVFVFKFILCGFWFVCLFLFRIDQSLQQWGVYEVLLLLLDYDQFAYVAVHILDA